MDPPICIGLNASFVAQVARPACHIVHLDSTGGLVLDLYDRRNVEVPLDRVVPLKTAVTALITRQQRFPPSSASTKPTSLLHWV